MTIRLNSKGEESAYQAHVDSIHGSVLSSLEAHSGTTAADIQAKTDLRWRELAEMFSSRYLNSPKTFAQEYHF